MRSRLIFLPTYINCSSIIYWEHYFSSIELLLRHVSEIKWAYLRCSWLLLLYSKCWFWVEWPLPLYFLLQNCFSYCSSFAFHINFGIAYLYLLKSCWNFDKIFFFIPGFKKFDCDVLLHSFVHVSCSWILSHFLELYVYDFHQIWKFVDHYFFKHILFLSFMVSNYLYIKPLEKLTDTFSLFSKLFFPVSHFARFYCCVFKYTRLFSCNT